MGQRQIGQRASGEKSGSSRVNGLGRIATRRRVWGQSGRSEAQVRIDMGKFLAGVEAIDKGYLSIVHVGDFSWYFQGQLASIQKKAAGFSGSKVAFHDSADPVAADIPASSADAEPVRNELDSEASRLTDRTVLEWTVLGQDSRSSSLTADLLSASSQVDFNLPAEILKQRKS